MKKFTFVLFFLFLLVAAFLAACDAVKVFESATPVATAPATPEEPAPMATPDLQVTIVALQEQVAALQASATLMSLQSVTVQPTQHPQVAAGSNVTEVFRAAGSLDYPVIQSPDPSRQPVFPDVAYGDRPAIAAYETPFEGGDFCDSTPCNVDLPQYYYRVMTAGEITIPGLGVSCKATAEKGCVVILINHFGPTAMWRENTIDHGFTVAGRVFDMDKPESVTLAAQALLDNYIYRMPAVPDGANCGTIEACPSVEWHILVIGDGEKQVHWTGLFHR